LAQGEKRFRQEAPGEGKKVKTGDIYQRGGTLAVLKGGHGTKNDWDSGSQVSINEKSSMLLALPKKEEDDLLKLGSSTRYEELRERPWERKENSFTRRRSISAE